MAITLGRLCEDAESTYGMKLLAGASGLDNFVRWVHTVEACAAPGFLHGSELVFTTGIAHSGMSWLGAFAEDLCANKAAGIALNIGPYMDCVPQKVIAYCEKNSMPLFTVPWDVHLTDITYDFCHRIIANEEVEVGLATAFKNLIFEPHDEKAYRYTLEKCDFPKSASYCVVALHVIPETQNEADFQSFNFLTHHILNKTGNAFSLFVHDNRLIAVLKGYSQKQIDDFLSELSQRFVVLNSGSRISAGISPLGEGYGFVTDGYHKAISALKVADARKEGSVHYQNLDLYKLLISVGSNQVLTEVYQENLGALEKFDNENGTDYMDSLRCYLEHNSSVQEVAQLTFVHRNTINYKIRRIREILGCEFTQENRLRLLLAFYIRDVL